MKIKSFEDLLVWGKARELNKLVYKITSQFPKDERFGLIDQIRRCSVSVMANIAEGFSRFHLKESVMFYRNARGSLSELKSHFYASFDQKYVTQKELDFIKEQIDEVGKMLNGLINSTKNFRDN
ncbi:MAG TPA: four helix bundle protein [Patescibacteria group bacterium]